MVIPSIYCCYTCSCSDNDIDIDFDFNDSGDDETTPLNDKDTDNKNTEKPAKNKQNNKKKNNRPRNKNTKNTKNENVFYFYYKHSDNTHAQDSNISNDYLSEYIKSLNLGNISSMRFINTHDNERHSLNYAKITYKTIHKKLEPYMTASQIDENAIALYFNNAFVIHPILLNTIQSNINNCNNGNNRILYDNNIFYYTIDYILCMSRNKPGYKPYKNTKVRSNTIAIEQKSRFDNDDMCLPSSDPIDIPNAGKNGKKEIKHLTFV